MTFSGIRQQLDFMLKGTLMQIWKSAYIFVLHMSMNLPKISHYKTLFFVRYVYVRYVKCLFTNIQKQQNTLKNGLLFQIFINFKRNSQEQECAISMLLFLHEYKYIGRFSNLHQCTFKPFIQDVGVIEKILEASLKCQIFR